MASKQTNTTERIVIPPLESGEFREVVKITPPNLQLASFRLIGETHFAVHHFSAKAQQTMMEAQSAGSQTQSKRKRPPKDFAALYNAARYRARKGNWDGMNAGAFRNGCISACRLVGFKMTHAKLSIFVLADGEDATDGTPLVRIHGPEPEMWVAPARNADGSFDLRSRPRWMPGEWSVNLRVRFDRDQFSLNDVTNLLARVGQQVGIGEGRPDSRDSAGIGYGLFIIESEPERKQ